MEKVLQQPRLTATPVNEPASMLEWGIASSTRQGEVESGDLHTVKHFEGGVLIAVVDGLGHGREAAAVARVAAQTLEDYCKESPIALLRRVHQQLQMTRGAVMSMVSFNPKESTISWLGIGNVETVLLRSDPTAQPKRETAPLRGGVVGYQIPQPYAAVVPVRRGDLLIMATDGIAMPLHLSSMESLLSPQQIADVVFARQRLVNDDALILVARFTHGSK